jgi:hypothetical protein
MRPHIWLPSLAVWFALTCSAVTAQPTAMSDSDYMAKVATGAPAAVVKNATVVRMGEHGAMQTLQTGTNGFTCMMIFGAPMCADRYAMLWAHALQTKTVPPAGTGLVYMLAGDSGTNNVDPYAMGADAHAHWVVQGPHVMIVGTGVTSMGYPMTADADNTAPYIMWATTPYAHLMIPVTASP